MVRPFFYLNNQHTLFVEPSLVEIPIHQTENFGVDAPVLEGPDDSREEIVNTVETPVAEGWQFDQRAKVRMQVKNDWFTNSAALFKFDEYLIARDGGIDFVALSAASPQR